MPRIAKPKPDLSPEAVRARLRALIAESGRPAASVAESAEMSPSYLSNVLSGVKAKPEITTIARVLAALGKTWRDLD